MVGGSGLYINALCNGLDDLPEIDLNIRTELNQLFEAEGLATIQTQLQKLDPEYFAKVDQNNPQRMIRGLEIVLSTGKHGALITCKCCRWWYCVNRHKSS
jgi:tRNA dimethylallyltransferase